MAWLIVEEKRGCGEGFSPEARWKRCMKQKGAYALVESAERLLGLVVLLARVRAGQGEHCAVVSEK